MPAEIPSVDIPLTPDERERLLPSLSSRAQLNEIERLNINAARVWAMRAPVLGRESLLTEPFCRELHRRMFNGIWRSAGRYRTAERNPGWEPHRIAEGVGLFLDDAEGWLRYSTYPVHEVAVRIGNGRHARLIADILVAAHGERALTWGSREPGSARKRYGEAIDAADAGDFGPLLEFALG
jgi:Fic-DOC domain mobile mystery protein B